VVLNENIEYEIICQKMKICSNFGFIGLIVFDYCFVFDCFSLFLVLIIVFNFFCF